MHSLSLVNFWYFHWLFAILLCSDSLIINHNYYLSSVQKTSKSDSTLKNRKSAFQLFNLRNPIFLLLRTEMSIFHYKTSDFFLLRTQKKNRLEIKVKSKSDFSSSLRTQIRFFTPRNLIFSSQIPNSIFHS